MPVSSPVIGLGEVLWDMLPSGKQLGGAPFNFVVHCHQLGHPAFIISRVGRDELGREIRAALLERSLSDEYLQEDPDRPTGTVNVELDKGQPKYDIVEDVAYDQLAVESAWPDLFGRAAAVCFGTLAQRSPLARAVIHQGLRLAKSALIICDVNLRQHYYDRETIEASLRASRWVKLNDGELATLREMLSLGSKDITGTLLQLRRRFDLELACLTRGEHGCLIQTNDALIDLPSEQVEVVDTVGAGDAFTAGLVVAHLEGKSIGEAAALANQLAGRVVGTAGGTPRIRRAEFGT